MLLMPQIEKLRLAAEMLPPDDGHQKAARLVEQATQVPCALSSAPGLLANSSCGVVLLVPPLAVSRNLLCFFLN
jgi:hypothetical protein